MDKKTKTKNSDRNNFYEKAAVISAVFLLIFIGLSFFLKPLKETEYKIDSVELNFNKEINLDEKKVEKKLSLAEINKAINPPDIQIRQNKQLNFAQRKHIAELRRKKDELLRKHKGYYSNYKPQSRKLKKEKSFEENIQPVKNTPAYTQEAEITVPIKKNFQENDERFDIYLDTPCSKEEIEYVLKLYPPSATPITLIFRKEHLDNSNIPEIIYATIPNNSWKNASESLENVLSSIFGEFFQEENNSDDNKTKISAMFTTPCSTSAYVSQGFYVSKNPPALMNSSSASSYCRSKNGRLPDILEIMSIMRHKQIPQGYYITSSERLNSDRVTGKISPLGDYLVMHYIGNNIYFTNTSKLPAGQSIFAECVLK